MLSNEEYRKSRKIDEPVNLVHAKEEWLKIKKEREDSNYKFCIKTDYLRPTFEEGSTEPLPVIHNRTLEERTLKIQL